MQNVPFGTGLLFTRDKDSEDSEKSDALLRCIPYSEEKRRNLLAGQESLFIQYACLELYPDAKIVASGYHAGPGEQVCGKNRRQKLDLTVVYPGGKIIYLNYHGLYFHSRNKSHKHDCPRFIGEHNSEDKQESLDYHNDETKVNDEFRVGYIKALNLVTEKDDSCGSELKHKGPIFEYKVYDECDLFHTTDVYR